jgi:hypothetical protein
MTAPSLLADPSQVLHLDGLCDRFEEAWAAGQRPAVEDYLGDTPEPGRSALARELILLEVHYRRRAGEDCPPAEYQRRFPMLDPAWLARAAGGTDSRTTQPDSPPGAPAGAASLPAVAGYELKIGCRTKLAKLRCGEPSGGGGLRDPGRARPGRHGAGLQGPPNEVDTSC